MAVESSTTDILLLCLGALIAALGYLLSRLLTRIEDTLKDLDKRLTRVEFQVGKSNRPGSDVLPMSGGNSA